MELTEFYNGKCISGDSIVLTNDGMVEIGDYFDVEENGEEVYSLYKDLKIQNRYGELEEVEAGVYSGYKDTVKIKTSEGYEIEPSLNHPLLIMNKKGKLVWKKSEKLKVGDYLCISRGDNVFGNKTTLDIDMERWFEQQSPASQRVIVKYPYPKELTEKMALVMGYLTGDGSLTRENMFCLTNVDEDIIDNFNTFIKEAFGYQTTIIKNRIDFVINSKFIRQYFYQLGFDYSDAYEKEIPKCIMTAPKNIVAKYIQGLFDTDGGVENTTAVSFCTASEKLSKQVQTVLLNFGIVSNRRLKHSKQFKTNAYIITITGANLDIFYKEIGFSCQRKQDKLKEICDTNIKRNTNIDIIPFQKDKINSFCEKVKKFNGELKDKLYHVRKGNNQLTYSKLKLLLNANNAENEPEHEEFTELNQLGYFYSKIDSITPSKAHVYDLSVPQTNSFIANGFVNHNTFIEVLALILTAIFYPGVNLSMTAQTRELFLAPLYGDIHRITS